MQANLWLEPRRESRRVGVAAAFCGFAGALLGAATLLVGAAVAVMFAVALLVVTLLATLLVGLSALAWRLRPDLVAPKPAGHAWIAYRPDDRR